MNRLRNRALLGNLLVVIFAVLLALAIVHRADGVSDTLHRHHHLHASIRATA